MVTDTAVAVRNFRASASATDALPEPVTCVVVVRFAYADDFRVDATPTTMVVVIPAAASTRLASVSVAAAEAEPVADGVVDAVAVPVAVAGGDPCVDDVGLPDALAVPVAVGPPLLEPDGVPLAAALAAGVDAAFPGLTTTNG